MLSGGQHQFRDIVASAMGWWLDAGVDTPIDEHERDWLAVPAKPAAPVSPASTTVSTPAAALPNDLATLQTFLATGPYVPMAPPPARRVAPTGDPASGLMIVADMPEAGDADAGRLFAGETARLFEAMLGAMGRDRDSVYLAPLSPARLSGRGMDPATIESLVALMRRHIALARPRGVMLLGEASARLLLDGATPGQRGLLSLHHDAAIIPAIALTSPRMMRLRPALKAAAWADMRQLIGVLAS
jgi:DNA polymerase